MKPYCFVSYSSREAHVPILIDCLRIAFGIYVEVKLTPSDLESGAALRGQIIGLIKDCSFAVVILDGLRPNVVFELGLIYAEKKPLMLFKEADAQVDILGLYSGPTAELSAKAPPVNLDTQLSDVKDIYQAAWNKFDVEGTIKLVWSEYVKKKNDIEGYVEIPEPKLWQ